MQVADKAVVKGDLGAWWADLKAQAKSMKKLQLKRGVIAQHAFVHRRP